jgi:hypothetical protein
MPTRAERRKIQREKERMAMALKKAAEETARKQQDSTVDRSVPSAEHSSLYAGLGRFGEHPITLAAFAVILGVVGLFLYTPILWACGGMFLIAFYRSKAVAGRPWGVQVLSYAVLISVIFPALYLINRLLERKEKESKAVASAADGQPSSRLM